MDAIRIIQDDHDAMRELFEQLAASRARSHRETVACQIIAELSIQAAIEAHIIYPAVRRLGQENADHVIAALEAHHVPRLVLTALDEMHAGDERFATTMAELRTTVELHFEELESDLLPILTRSLEHHQLVTLGQAILSFVQSAPGRTLAAQPTRPGRVHGQAAARLRTAEARRQLMAPGKPPEVRSRRRRRVSVVRSLVRAPLDDLLVAD